MRAPSAFAGFRLALALYSVLATLTCAARPVDDMGVRIGPKRLSSAVEAHHSCLVRADGTTAGWGRNDGGAIGDGTTTDRLVPTALPASR